MLRLTILLSVVVLHCVPANGQTQDPRVRRPIAITASADDQWIYVANRDSGTISVIDAQKMSVASELPTEGTLTDLVRFGDAHLLALDQKHHQLLVLSGDGPQWTIVSRTAVPEYPVRIAVDQHSKRCFVTSLWSRTVTSFDLSDLAHNADSAPAVLKQRQLSFEPLELCLAKDGSQIIVAGAYRGVLAVMDADLTIVAERPLRGHNIRGLEISADGRSLLVAQQELNPLARATFDDVHWGNVISNQLTVIPLTELRNVDSTIEQRAVTLLLGDPGRAGGDPGTVHAGSNGHLAVLLGGIDEVAIRKPGDDRWHRVSVERHPSALAATSDNRLWITNQFSDSISVIDIESGTQIASVALGPQPELTPAQRGEQLFYDSRLSLDGWMSCHSCHTDGHSNERLNDNLSDGTFGAPKRVLSLLGARDTGPWAWNGQVRTLEAQVANSIQTTMQGPAPSDEQVAALVAYLKELAPPPASHPGNDEQAAAIARGSELFESLGCQQCHTPPTFTSRSVYDVGLADPLGTNSFNPPSLRGVSRRHSFFHDGRAQVLRDVFTRHQHQLGRELTATELDDLLAYLCSL